MIVRGLNSTGVSDAVQNVEGIYEKIEKLFTEYFFILVKSLVFFQNISFKEKTFKFNPKKHCKFLDTC